MQNYNSLGGAPYRLEDPLENNIKRILELENPEEDTEHAKLIQIRDQLLSHIRSSHVVGSEDIFRKTWKLLVANNREASYPNDKLPQWGQDLWDGLVTGYSSSTVTFLEWLQWRFGRQLFEEVSKTL